MSPLCLRSLVWQMAMISATSQGCCENSVKYNAGVGTSRFTVAVQINSTLLRKESFRNKLFRLLATESLLVLPLPVRGLGLIPFPPSALLNPALLQRAFLMKCPQRFL